ncbi:MAG TPA: O-antigen ligase [Candidatus Baltobacteraceae bacterium]|nr:O-antigen ligase [Candidatus Baltobacteraceae bacterium]
MADRKMPNHLVEVLHHRVRGLPRTLSELNYPTVEENVFAVCVLLYSSSAFAVFLKGSNEVAVGISTGFLVTNSISVFIYLVGAYFLVTRCNWNLQIVRQIPWLFGLTLLPVASVLWSDVPWITTLRAGALVGTTVVGVYLGVRYDSVALLRLLGWSLGIAGVLSFLAGWLVPTYGIGTGVFEGDWIGVFAHKNTLGSNMALGFLVFSLLARTSRYARWFLWVLCCLSLALVFLADSAGSKITCAFLVSVMFYDAAIRPRVKRIWMRYAVVSSLASLVVAQAYLRLQDILGVLGRDETMTGRMEVWSLLWPMLQERTWLGYGYGAFWLGYDGPSAEVWQELGEGAFSSSHNGYLEIWTSCGLLGLTLFAICLLGALRKAFARSREGATPDRSWPLYFLLFLIIYNLADTTFLLANHIFWLTFVAVVVQLCRLEGKSMPKRQLLNAQMQPRFEPGFPA